MELYQPGQDHEEKPKLELEGRLVQLYKLTEVKMGQELSLSGTAVVSGIEQKIGEDGLPTSCVEFTIKDMSLEPATPTFEQQVQALFPSSPR